MTAPASASFDLRGRVALVTGATRGVGRGVALALGAAGATVHVTGRTKSSAVPEDPATKSSAVPKDAATTSASTTLPGSLDETVAAVEGAGGTAFGHVCDHANDDDVRAVMAAIAADEGRLDILVNNVFAVPNGPLFDTPFWEQPIAQWDTMHTVGLRSHYVASTLAAPLLLASEHGLVANISSFGGASYQVSVAYGVGKAGVDRLARDMAKDLRAHGVAVVSLYPGIVRTERVLAGQLPFSTEVSESPELTGRAIAALAADPARMERTGKVLVVAELAEEYGFVDIDGSKPVSLRR